MKGQGSLGKGLGMAVPVQPLEEPASWAEPRQERDLSPHPHAKYSTEAAGRDCGDSPRIHRLPSVVSPCKPFSGNGGEGWEAGALQRFVLTLSV